MSSCHTVDFYYHFSYIKVIFICNQNEKKEQKKNKKKKKKKLFGW